MRTNRNITQQEETLIKQLLTLLNDDRAASPGVNVVVDLNDGNMGSIRFKRTENRKYGRDLIQVQYTDSDSQFVYITLTEDDQGDLYELEFWKVDFKPLIKYPKLAELLVVKDNSCT